jgi:anti-sigma factor RsiW
MLTSELACLDEDAIVTFLAGTLDAGRREAVARHISICESCFAVVAAVAGDDVARIAVATALAMVVAWGDGVP